MLSSSSSSENYLSSSSSSSSSGDEADFYLRRTKTYRIRENCFEKYDDQEFYDRFRLSKPTVVALLRKIEHNISLTTNRGGYIKPMTRLLLTLRFYASGSMLIAAGVFVGVSKASACRIVKSVSYAIASLRPQYINMYRSVAEMEKSAESFYSIARFPRVIGAIDCTLIKIQSPGGEDAEIYRCRKGYFALNVQTVSDANLKIINIVARWPGSSHDQTIFNNSSLKRQFENGQFGQHLLIGDSGYAIQPYLMTKLQQTNSEAENLYNEAIIRSRNVVERQYGVWKRRFPILSLGIRLALSTTMQVIMATAVLHNIALEMNEVVPINWHPEQIMENDDENVEVNHIDNHAHGRNVRQILIEEHFARL